MNVSFVLEKKPNQNGTLVDTLMKVTTDANGVAVTEDWCTVEDLDRLFNACSYRWSEYGWDLDKLIQCVNECEFD